MAVVNGKVLTARELAARWGWNVGSLANQRARRQGPRFYRIGRAVVYPLRDVVSYEKSHPEVFPR